MSPAYWRRGYRKHASRHFAEQGFNEVHHEDGGCEDELESGVVQTRSLVSLRYVPSGCTSRSESGVGGGSLVSFTQQTIKVSARVVVADELGRLTPVDRGGQQRHRSQPLVFVNLEVDWEPIGSGGRSGVVVARAGITGFSS